jgi:hypothetical protein
MTQYLLSVFHDGGYPVEVDPVEMQAVFAAVDRFNTKLEKLGALVFAGGLTEPSTTKVVDASRGEVAFTDGPFSEAKEVLGGFWVIEAESLDAALALAQEGSVACANPVEVRAFSPE